MADKTIYLGEMIYDEENATLFWLNYQTGAGGLGVTSFTTETSIVKHGGISTKVIIGAGSFYNVGVYHLFGNTDWSDRLGVLLHYYNYPDWIGFYSAGGAQFHRYILSGAELSDGEWKQLYIPFSNFDNTLNMDLSDCTYFYIIVDSRQVTFYVDFMIVGCELDFVTDYRRKRTSKIALHKIAGGVSRRDKDGCVRDRGYTIKARVNRVIDACLESFDDSKKFLGLDDGVRLDVVWMDTFESHEQAGYENTRPVIATLNLLVSAS